MSVINIFLTHPDAEGFEPFEHDGTHFVFSKVDANGPRQLVEGQVWAFIDWVLEDIAGLEMCRRLRAAPQTAGAHITMVLEEADPECAKRALSAGADDYMVGPINRRVVLDRVLALRPGSGGKFLAERFERGALMIDMLAHRAFWAGKAIDISPNEFRLLRFLADNANQVLSRQDILNGLRRAGEHIDERTVDVWIGRLRRPIKAVGGGNPIRTVRSIGYVLDLD